MSSEYVDKHNGGMAKYRSSEGKVKKIPIRDCLGYGSRCSGGLRSTGTYGASRIKDFPNAHICKSKSSS